MNSGNDRRAPGAQRVPFEAMVEVGGALGPSFEAQAVNLSEDGMSLRTAYLPEVGQPVTCRFDAGQGLVVVAAGEVLWRQEQGDGGEFGIRFTNLDGTSAEALHAILVPPGAPRDRKVRLHIEGLASPMRARLRRAEGENVTAYSELGFLKVGKPLELEDTSTGAKRPAVIDRVSVEVQRDSRIPELVVSLRYDDGIATAALDTSDDVTDRDQAPYPRGDDATDGEPISAAQRPEDARHATSAAAHPFDVTPSTATYHGEDELDESHGLKSAFARHAAKVGPMMERLAKRAKTTVSVLAAKRRASKATEAPIRRTTAPPPGGGLHTAGRKVVRGEMIDARHEIEPAPRRRGIGTGTKVAIAGAITLVSVAASAMIFRRPAAPLPPPAPVAAATTAEAPAPAPPPVDVAAVAPAPLPALPGSDPLAAAGMEGDDLLGEPQVPAKKSNKKIKVKPFTNGAVSHGNVLRIRMDGPIEAIQGAPQPTGFAVVLPGRKSVEQAAPLAARDSRISKVRVSNEPGGAELTVEFKDGVPNYLVRARGETLEVVLARTAHHASKAAKAGHHAGHHGTKKKSKKHH